MSLKPTIEDTDVTGLSPEDFNRRLKKLRKRAKQAKAGRGGARAARALKRVKRMKKLGLEKSCCAKPYRKRCSKCPRNAPDLVLAPLGDKDKTAAQGPAES